MNSQQFYNIKEKMTNDNILELLAPSVFNPTKEKLLSRAQKYQENENVRIYAYEDNQEFKGIVVVEILGVSATILDIAVKPEYQKSGIGSKLVDFIFSKFSVKSITAETDDDAIGFYKKYGFAVVKTEMKYDTKRYTCVCDSMYKRPSFPKCDDITHYD